MKIIVEKLNEKINILRKVDVSRNDKLTYAVKKINTIYQNSIKEAVEKYNSSILDYRVQFASVDEEGNLILSSQDKQGNDTYKYKPEKLQQLTKKLEQALKDYNRTEVEMDSYIVDMNTGEYDRAKSIFDDFEIEQLQGILFTKCGVGEVWDGTKCVVDPLPPDPTHPKE